MIFHWSRLPWSECPNCKLPLIATVQTLQIDAGPVVLVTCEYCEKPPIQWESLPVVVGPMAKHTGNTDEIHGW